MAKFDRRKDEPGIGDECDTNRRGCFSLTVGRALIWARGILLGGDHHIGGYAIDIGSFTARFRAATGR